MSHHDIMDITRTIWFSYSHVLTASLALFADLFYCIDHGVPEAELDEKRYADKLPVKPLLFLLPIAPCTAVNSSCALHQSLLRTKIKTM